MTAVSLERALESLLIQGLDDFIGLWQLKSPTSSDSDPQAAAFALADRMITSGWFRIGELRADGSFEAWSDVDGDVIHRLRHSWSDHGNPKVFEMEVWFELTESGAAVAQRRASQ
jgi:hypothetical protein